MNNALPTATTAAELKPGDIFKSHRRRAIVIENTGEKVRYSLLRKNGQPFTPIYAMTNMAHEVETI